MSKKIQKGPEAAPLSSSVDVGIKSLPATIYIESQSPKTSHKEEILEIFPPKVLQFLLTFKFEDGSTVIDVTSLDHELIYYLKHLLDRSDIQTFINELSERIYQDRYDLLFSDQAYNSAKISLVSELEAKNIAFEIEEGMYQCPNCKGNKTISSNKQTRSADEGEKVKVECTQCGYGWRINS